MQDTNGTHQNGGPAEPSIILPDGTPARAAEISHAAVSGAAAAGDQLARLEDKTARIEEKLSRFEAANQRVVDRFELASGRMGEVALGSDLSALRQEVGFLSRRVRKTAGFGAVVAGAVIGAVLSAALIVATLRYAPGLLAR